MKIDELREKDNEELIKLKKELEFNLVKASSNWGIGTVKDNKTIKGAAKRGEKTSLRKDIRRNIARINTIINER